MFWRLEEIVKLGAISYFFSKRKTLTVLSNKNLNCGFWFSLSMMIASNMGPNLNTRSMVRWMVLINFISTGFTTRTSALGLEFYVYNYYD